MIIYLLFFFLSMLIMSYFLLRSLVDLKVSTHSFMKVEELIKSYLFMVYVSFSHSRLRSILYLTRKFIHLIEIDNCKRLMCFYVVIILIKWLIWLFAEWLIVYIGKNKFLSEIFTMMRKYLVYKNNSSSLVTRWSIYIYMVCKQERRRRLTLLKKNWKKCKNEEYARNTSVVICILWSVDSSKNIENIRWIVQNRIRCLLMHCSLSYKKMEIDMMKRWCLWWT